MIAATLPVLSMPAAAGVAVVMVLAGLRTHALERRAMRRCPACGRDIRMCHCCS